MVVHISRMVISNSNNRERIILNIIILTFNLLFLDKMANNDRKPSTILRTISNMVGKDRDMASRDITMLMAHMAISSCPVCHVEKKTKDGNHNHNSRLIFVIIETRQ
jgi:hypothetical protein